MKIKSYDKVKFFKKELNVSNLDKKRASKFRYSELSYNDKHKIPTIT